MNLEVVAKKLSALAKKMKADIGPLELLGLFLRDDALDSWDLVIAAPPLQANNRDSFKYVADRLREALTEEELAGLSRIVIMDHGGAVLNGFLDQFKGRTGLCDIHFVADGGAIVRKAYIIIARALPVGRSGGQTAKKPRQGSAGSRHSRQSSAGNPQ
jgi:hypothetical protein